MLWIELVDLIRLCLDRVTLNPVGGPVDHYGSLNLLLREKLSVSWRSCQVESAIPAVFSCREGTGRSPTKNGS